MNFECILNSIQRLNTDNLPGRDAHQQMSHRNLPIKLPENLKAKPAAVTLLIYAEQNEKYQLILTKRPAYLKEHANQICFPGGKFEKTDITLENTAQRELTEELGINYPIHYINQLTPVYVTVSNYLITPFIAYSDVKPTINFNQEIESMMEVNFKTLLDPKNTNHTIININQDLQIHTPCFNFNNQIVWGATAMILNEFKEILKNIYLQ